MQKSGNTFKAALEIDIDLYKVVSAPYCEVRGRLRKEIWTHVGDDVPEPDARMGYRMRSMRSRQIDPKENEDDI